MEKITLPIKTKLAAWGMMGIGVLCIALGIFSFFNENRILKELILLLPVPYFWWQFLLFALVPQFGYISFGIFSFFISLFLLKGKKWIWIVSIILFLIFVIFSIYGMYLPNTDVGGNFPLIRFIVDRNVWFAHDWVRIIGYLHISDWLGLIIFMILFFLLLSDRKNFWKIAR